MFEIRDFTHEQFVAAIAEGRGMTVEEVLPFADGRFELLPRRTADAIVSGCLHAQLGAIERMFRLVASQPGAVCLLNGGAAVSLAPLLEIPLRRVDNLVLEGLACMLAEL